MRVVVHTAPALRHAVLVNHRVAVHAPPGQRYSLALDLDQLWEQADEDSPFRRSYLARKLRQLLKGCRPESGRVLLYPRHWQTLATRAFRASCPDDWHLAQGVVRVTLTVNDLLIEPLNEEATQ